MVINQSEIIFWLNLYKCKNSDTSRFLFHLKEIKRLVYLEKNINKSPESKQRYENIFQFVNNNYFEIDKLKYKISSLVSKKSIIELL